jgi:hypothetical protein
VDVQVDELGGQGRPILGAAQDASGVSPGTPQSPAERHVRVRPLLHHSAGWGSGRGACSA